MEVYEQAEPTFLSELVRGVFEFAAVFGFCVMLAAWLLIVA